MDTREAALQSFNEKSLRGAQAEETGGIRAQELVEQTKVSQGFASLNCKWAFFCIRTGFILSEAINWWNSTTFRFLTQKPQETSYTVRSTNNAIMMGLSLTFLVHNLLFLNQRMMRILITHHRNYDNDHFTQQTYILGVDKYSPRSGKIFLHTAVPPPTRFRSILLTVQD